MVIVSGTPWRAVLDHPPVNGGVIHMDTTFEHKFFDVARAQEVGDIPTDARQNDILWEMGPLKAHRHCLSPSLMSRDSKGDHTPNRLK
jgi:hypothetical protein